MTDKPKPTGSKQIFDVSHPSKTKAAATSKPVLVTNRTIIKDPMMTDTSSDSPATSPEPARVLDKVVIRPLSAPPLPEKEVAQALDTKENAAEEPTAVSEAEPEVMDTVSNTEPEAAPEEKIDEEVVEAKAIDTEETGENEEPSAADAAEEVEPADTGELKTKGAKAVIDEETEIKARDEQDTQVQKLIESKKYFLQIETTENRKAKRFIALGIVISLVLAAAWVNVALDAGLIHIAGIKPLTHFFSN